MFDTFLDLVLMSPRAVEGISRAAGSARETVCDTYNRGGMEPSDLQTF